MVMNLGPDFDNKVTHLCSCRSWVAVSFRLTTESNRIESQWALYYCATDPNEGYGNVSHVTYVRTSSDLMDWSDSFPVIAFDAGPTGSPYGGNPSYIFTHSKPSHIISYQAQQSLRLWFDEVRTSICSREHGDPITRTPTSLCLRTHSILDLFLLAMLPKSLLYTSL